MLLSPPTIEKSQTDAACVLHTWQANNAHAAHSEPHGTCNKRAFGYNAQSSKQARLTNREAPTDAAGMI
jgi:hypothetical protein